MKNPVTAACAGALVAGSLFAAGPAAPVAGLKPNVIFILADDLGWGDIGVFHQNQRRAAGLPAIRTPHLDAMARDGVQLRDHYCAAPVCAPARASLLLGVHQGHANVRDNQFDKALANNHTLGTVLGEAGYATAAIGKWGLQGGGHNPREWPAYPTKRGFDTYFGCVRHKDGHEHYPKEGVYDGPKECYDGVTNITSYLDKCYTTDLFTARAKKWIADRVSAAPSQPFFLYLAFDTPHAVLELPTQAYPSGGGLEGGVQWLGEPHHMINTASGEVDSWVHPAYRDATCRATDRTQKPWPDVYRRYATAVTRIDECVGDLLQLLKDLGIDGHTLVVFSSDNGPSQESYLNDDYEADFFASFGPFDGIKRDTWEGGVRVPAIVRWPGQVAGGRIDPTPSMQTDWMATFAELAGVPPPARSDGVSLLPVLRGHGALRPSKIYVEYFYAGATPAYAAFEPSRRGRQRNQMQAVRLGDFMGVRYDVKSASDDFEIYDVALDPKETVNLARRDGNEFGVAPHRESKNIADLQQEMKRSVLQMRRPEGEAPRPYDGAAIPAIAVDPAGLAPGVGWRAFEGEFPWVPELTTFAPVKTGVCDRPTLDVRPRDHHFGILFEGYIQAPADGDYTFYLSTDSRALVRLHEAVLLDADFGYGFVRPTEINATVRLVAGLHPVRIYYVEGSGGTPRLSLEWEGPHWAKQPIPATAFRRVR